MTAPPPDEHSGLRPLSPHGEGYCRVCHFVIGLNYDGRLEQHGRGALLGSLDGCKGSGRVPPKVTPYASRKAAFTVKAPEVWCPECKQTVSSTRQGGAQVYARHSYQRTGGPIPKICLFTNRGIVKDERG